MQQQEQIGSKTNRGRDAGQLRHQIETLQQTINIGEWGKDDQAFIREQTQKLTAHKRKLDETNDGNLLLRVR